MNAREHFGMAAGATALTSIAICLVLAAVGLRVFWLAAGTTMGAAAETAILGFALHRLYVPIIASPNLQCPGTADLSTREYSSLAINNLVVGGSLFLDQSNASLPGAGAVSLLNYGTRLISVLLSLGPEALGVAVLPKFSRIVSENGADKFVIL